MKMLPQLCKGSLITLTLLQALTAQAYFDKAQYLNYDDQAFTSEKKSLSLLDDSNQKAATASIEKILGYVTANINKNAETYGPIYRHETRDQEKYGDEIVKIILKSAHAKAKRYLDEGNPQAYYAFLTLALTVPNQEGLFVHFREVEADRDHCNDERSLGENIKSDTAKKNFQMAFNGAEEKKFSLRNIFGGNDEDSQESENFLVKCKELRGEKTYKQLIVGGSDGSDVGMFQLSALWHYDEFLAVGKYDSVKQTVDYGLQYLRQQFHHGYRNASEKYTCMLNENQEIDYMSLIRGSWSAYNGGPSQKCRFADPDNAFAGHDRGFKKNLQITLNLNNGGFFGFAPDSSLELSPSVRSAVEEVVTNLEKKTNRSVALKSLLDS